MRVNTVTKLQISLSISIFLLPVARFEDTERYIELCTVHNFKQLINS